MEIKLALKMNDFQQSIFTELAEYKRKKQEEGLEIIDLSIGSPDLPPPTFVKERIAKYARDDSKYGYALKGTDQFHRAVSNFYNRNYNVSLHETEIIQLIGSQDGLVHLPLVLCNPGDYILMPDPGYTAYETGASVAGANIYPMPLKKENHFLPNLKEIPKEIREKAKLMILNFPGNPVPTIAPKEFFIEVVEFAKENNIVILHDFAYSELYFDEKPISFLSIPGAKDVGIEMNSLSKSFNMAGCRIAYAAGNEQIIQALADLKSNLDYGVFYPIQEAATLALNDESAFLEELREIYKKRRDILIRGFNDLGWNVQSPKATMFIWAEIPSQFTSREFAFRLIDEAGIVVTPGNAFGKWGEGFVRIALVQSEEKLKTAITRLKNTSLFR